MQAMPIRVLIDDMSSVEVQALIAEHLAGMRGNSPAGARDVTFKIWP